MTTSTMSIIAAIGGGILLIVVVAIVAIIAIAVARRIRASVVTFREGNMTVNRAQRGFTYHSEGDHVALTDLNPPPGFDLVPQKGLGYCCPAVQQQTQQAPAVAQNWAQPCAAAPAVQPAVCVAQQVPPNI